MPPGATGGTERYVAALDRHWRETGVEAELFFPTGPTRGFRASWADPAAEARFARVLDRLRPDVVHVHHLSGLSLRLPARAKASGARVVLTLHDAWVDCARGQLVDREGRRCAGPDPGRCRRCLAPRGPARVLGPGRAALGARAEAAAAVRESVDRVLAPSEHLAERLGWSARVLPLPLLDPLPLAAPRAPGPLALLFLGAMLPSKGPHLVLEAFARLPAGAARLTLAGPTPRHPLDPRYGERLRARAAEVPGVNWRGPVDPSELPRLHAEHDVLVFASTWVENHPLVLVEAGAAGLRVVAADVPGARAVAPGARWFAVGSVPSLLRALGEELVTGQARATPSRPPTLAEHARVLWEVYRG